MTPTSAQLFSKCFSLGLSLGHTTNHTSENHSDSEQSQMGFAGGLIGLSGWSVLRPGLSPSSCVPFLRRQVLGSYFLTHIKSIYLTDSRDKKKGGLEVTLLLCISVLEPSFLILLTSPLRMTFTILISVWTAKTSKPRAQMYTPDKLKN